MSILAERITTCEATRVVAAQFIANAFSRHSASLSKISEADQASVLYSMFQAVAPAVYPGGWYDPPPQGIAVLAGNAADGFKRLQFDSLRLEEYWPKKDVFLERESVVIVYVSPIHAANGIMGDIGGTLYAGADQKIREHVRETYAVIREAAAYAEPGMKFKELYAKAISLFEDRSKGIGFMTTVHDPLKGWNLGHTVPGSYDTAFPEGKPFEEAKDLIRASRFYINKAEEFQIPETSAFTFEARLMDARDSSLPNVFFHFIVTFVNGERKILSNTDGIFKSAGMDYML